MKILMKIRNWFNTREEMPLNRVIIIYGIMFVLYPIVRYCFDGSNRFPLIGIFIGIFIGRYTVKGVLFK